MQGKSLRFFSAVISIAHMAPAFSFPDGAIDPSFGTDGKQVVAFDAGGSFHDDAQSAAMLPGGSVVVAGSAELASNQFAIALAHLTSDGELIEKFWHQPAGLPRMGAMDIAVKEDGRIIIAGIGYVAPGAPRAIICRFMGISQTDASFANDPSNPIAGSGCRVILPTRNSELDAIYLSPGGDIFAAGSTEVGGVEQGLVVRVSSSGSLIDDFGVDGAAILMLESVHSMHIHDLHMSIDGKLFLAAKIDAVGGIADSDWGVLKVDVADGSLDNDFSGDGLSIVEHNIVENGEDIPRSIHVTGNSILVAGEVEAEQGRCPAVARLSLNGEPDQSFNGGLWVGGELCALGPVHMHDLLVQSNNRITIGGTRFGDFFAARLLSSGEEDPSFGDSGTTSFGFGQWSYDEAFRLLDQGGHILMFGSTDAGNEDNGMADLNFGVMRLYNDLIFFDDNE